MARTKKVIDVQVEDDNQQIDTPIQTVCMVHHDRQLVADVAISEVANWTKDGWSVQ